MSSADDKTIEAIRICNLMKAYTQPALAALYRILSEEKGVLIGSGTFLSLCEKTYLLTAAHVIDEGKKYAGIAHTSASGSKPELLRYPFRVTEPTIDLAIALVDVDIVREHGISPWGVDNLRLSAANIQRDLLCVHGYPGEKSKWVPIVKGGIHSTSMPFSTSDGVSDWDRFDRATHMAVLYPKQGWFDEKHNTISTPLPFGISGSTVWQTNRRATAGADWTTAEPHCRANSSLGRNGRSTRLYAD